MADKAKNLLSKILNVPMEEISDDSSAENTRGWDSLVIMQLLVTLEEEFDIRISIKDVDFLKSISGINHLIEMGQEAEKGNQ